jgi:hypothetical protein
MQDKRLLCMDPSQLRLRIEPELRVRLFANEQVQIESAAVDELLFVLDTQETLGRLRAHSVEQTDPSGVWRG